MNKKLVLIATIIGLVCTAVMTVVTKLEFNYNWIVVLGVGLLNDIANVVIDFLGEKND